MHEREITRDRENTTLAIAKSELAKPRIATSARDKERELNRIRLLTLNVLASLLGAILMVFLHHLVARRSQWMSL